MFREFWSCINKIQIQLLHSFVLSQVRWAELTWCSTRFLLDIAATLQGHLVLLALLVTKEPAESLDKLVGPVSLETQVYLEIKEKEVLNFFFLWMFGSATKQAKWDGKILFNPQFSCFIDASLISTHFQFLMIILKKTCFIGVNVIFTVFSGLWRFAGREGRERISRNWYQRTKRSKWATRSEFFFWVTHFSWLTHIM